ncbi:hypothetical protein HOF92_00375 [bacterium]|nr:hypothetical protein [bacterium]
MKSNLRQVKLSETAGYSRGATWLFLLVFCTCNLSAKPVWNHERWRDAPDKEARLQSYTTFKPMDYFMVPTEGILRHRLYEDKFSLEDQSDYEDPNSMGPYSGTRLDIPVEEYYQKLIDNAPPDSGGAPSGYQTYQTRGPANDQAAPIPRENLQLLNFDPTASSVDDLHPYASVRNVAGLIYRSDEFTCDTSVKHPEYEIDPETSMSVEVRGSDGNLVLSGSAQADICYFLYLPRVKSSDGVEIGPYVGRAQVQDTVDPVTGGTEPKHNHTIELIENGLAPFLPLKNELQSKLTSGDYKIRYRHGRYLVPQVQGSLLLPHNGANILYNRRQADRVYHHERHEVKVTSKKSSPIWIAIVVGVLTLGVGGLIVGAITAAVVLGAVGAGVVTALLLPNDESSRTLSGTSAGIKGDFADAHPNKIYAYLALQASNDPVEAPFQDGSQPKFFAVAPLYLPDDGERSMLKQAREESIEALDADGNPLGSRPVNSGYFDQPDAALPAVNQEISDGEWKTKVFPDPRWYQIMKNPGYNHAPPPPTLGGTLGGLGAPPLTKCADSADSEVVDLCADFQPLMEALDDYFDLHFGSKDYTFGTNDGQKTQVKDVWTGGSGGSFTVGSRTFDASAEFSAFADLYMNQRTLIDKLQAESTVQQGGQTVIAPKYKKLAQTTSEGYLLLDRIQALDEVLYQASQETLAEKWFVNDQDEKSTRGGRAGNSVSTCQAEPPANRDACIDTEFGATAPGLLGDYYALEDFPPVQKAFGCYTAGCYQGAGPDGPQVLGILAHTEDLIGPGPSIPKQYNLYLDPTEKCAGAPVNPTQYDRAVCMGGKAQQIITGNPTQPNTPVNPERRFSGE